jgi:CheY-like chemotaxis protein
MMTPGLNPQPKPSVLVVEDETMLLMVMAETLRDAGYEVWEAENGEAALTILRNNPAMDVLISDMRMPGMNGYQVAERAQALRPDIKVLMMTGYAHDATPVKQASLPVLYKPFDFNQLPGVVQELLGSGRHFGHD